MFLFSCCTSAQSEFVYQVRQNYNKIHHTDSATTLHQKINNSRQHVLKIKKSNYQSLLKTTNSKNKFTDTQFPPHKLSLGDIAEVPNCNWKRLSEIVAKPTLFTTSIKPYEIMKSDVTDNYFLSALSAIVEEPRKIKQIFVSSDINSSGIYCVKLRIDGSIQEVIVDDYVPVDQMENPIFTPPNNSQIWISILQKAWAKVNGSYANIVDGNPAQVFKAFNFAPSQVFILEDKQQRKQKLWKILLEANQRKSPVSCSTSHNQQIQWIHLNIIPNHRYTLIYAGQVNHRNQHQYRIVRLRNPNGKTNWTGKCNIKDHDFWDNIMENQDKIKLTNNLNEDEGQMLMLYSDFVKYFIEIDISYQISQGNFIWEEIFFNGKNGSFWEIDITHEGSYFFQLHQESLRNVITQGEEKQYCRSTLMIVKCNQQKNYQYVSGSMKFAQQDVLVSTNLVPGKYIIYAKIDDQQGLGGYHKKASLSSYSNKLCKFRLVDKKSHPNILQTVFLNHGRQNKRQHYNHQKMWISWKLLFKQCGFAYIAFGNSKDSDKKFNVKFQSKHFQQMHFKLKSPYKANKQQQNTHYEISVIPGQQKIILARIINNRTTTLKFPPPIQMKIEDIVINK